jgi:hypothetical protein
MTIVPPTFSLQEIIAVLAVKRRGRNIYQSAKQRVPIEPGDEYRIDNKTPSQRVQKLEGIVLEYHQLRGGVVLPLSVLGLLLQEEMEPVRVGQDGVHRVGQVRHSLFRRKRRKMMKRIQIRSVSLCERAALNLTASTNFLASFTSEVASGAAS